MGTFDNCRPDICGYLTIPCNDLSAVNRPEMSGWILGHGLSSSLSNVPVRPLHTARLEGTIEG